MDQRSLSVSKAARRFLIEFDALGIMILATGEVLFLLPFSLAGSASERWATPHIIVMLLLGCLLLVAFPFVEKRVPAPFVPWQLLTNSTLVLICSINALFSIAQNTWSSYFTSYLQVIYSMSVSYAGYISSITNVVSGLFALMVGLAIRQSGRYKWLLIGGSPIYALFMGLLIYFRQPGTNIGFVIMCEIFLSFASSAIIICVQIGVVATVTHAEVATAFALLGLSEYVGNAIGDTISGAIWTNSLPGALTQSIPTINKSQLAEIYGSLDEQLSYPIGAPIRDGIIDAYAISQTRMLTAGIVATGLMLISSLFLKNVKVSDIQQVKGTVL